MELKQFDFSTYFKQYAYDKTKKFVAFYGNKGQDLFGNFWILSKNISYNGITANNVESLYHSAKFTNNIKQEFNNLSPLKAFYLSRQYQKYVRKDWSKIKDQVMLDLLRIKFKIPLCTLVLLWTEDKYIVEHNPVKGRDTYWSDNCDGSGQNKLGQLLMIIRKELSGTGIVDKPVDYFEWITK